MRPLSSLDAGAHGRITPAGESEVKALRDWRAAFRLVAGRGEPSARVAERIVSRGERLVHQGDECDAVFAIVSGWAALERVSSAGQRQIVDFALPGDLVGHHRDRDGASPSSVEALTDIWTLVMPRWRFRELLTKNDAVAQLYDDTLMAEIERGQRVLANVAGRSGPEKVAELIVQLLDRAIVDGGTPPARLPLSQVQIAAALGVTKVYVSRLAKALRERGLLDWKAGFVRVVDERGLRAFAAS